MTTIFIFQKYEQILPTSNFNENVRDQSVRLYLWVAFHCTWSNTQFTIITVSESPHSQAVWWQDQSMIDTTWHLNTTEKLIFTHHALVKGRIRTLGWKSKQWRSTCPMWYPSSAVTLSGNILFEVDLWPKRPESPLPKVKSFPSAVMTAECLNPHASWKREIWFKRNLIVPESKSEIFWNLNSDHVMDLAIRSDSIFLYLHHFLSLQSLDLFGSPLPFTVPVAEFPIIPITPAEHLSGLSESQWVSIRPVWCHKLSHYITY